MATSPRALALVCTLKPSPDASSTELMARQVLQALAEQGVEGECVRIADHRIDPGVAVDMGDGDEWPRLRQKLLEADVLVLATPTWVGHMSSIAQRVLERLNAESSQTDDEGRPSMYGKVAVIAVVGNEDGAHKIVADCAQALSDTGFTIPATGSTYWNSEAMNPKDYKDWGVTLLVDGLYQEGTARDRGKQTKEVLGGVQGRSGAAGGPEPAARRTSGTRARDQREHARLLGQGLPRKARTDPR